MANVEILVLLVAAALLMPLQHTTEAAEHVVGGSAGWKIPPQGATSLYTSFAANTTFRLNDILVFNFTTGFHNVVTLSKKHYNSCNVSEVMQSFDTAPARITLNRTGEFYFACSFPSHCSLGQKLSIHVTAGSSSLAPAEAPLSPPPAASRAAMPLVAVTLPVLFIAVATNVLF